MKAKYKIMLIAVMLATAHIGHSQNVENSKLVADMIENTFEESKCGLVFEVNPIQSGSYHVCFWVHPLQYEANIFATYPVYINDVLVGEIMPSKSGWQAIGLADNSVVALTKGKNKIVVLGDKNALPMIERVQFAQDYASAQINDDLFIDETSIDEIVGTYAMVQRINIRYTYNQQFYLTAGEQIKIESLDGQSHSLDLKYIYTPGSDTPQLAQQHLSWHNASEAYSTQSSNHKSCIDVKIPLTGYYMVKTRGGVNMQSQVLDQVKISIIGTDGYERNNYIVENCEAFYARLAGVIPADSATYTSRVTYNPAGGTLSPILCIEGGASEPGRVINQGGNMSLSSYFDLNTTPIIETTGYHLYNVSSLGSGACQVDLLYSSVDNVAPAMQMAKDNNTLNVSETTLGTMKITPTSDSVKIVGALNGVIYSLDGTKLTEASSENGEEICLSTAELPIGIYVVKATDDNGNSLMRKIVLK